MSVVYECRGWRLRMRRSAEAAAHAAAEASDSAEAVSAPFLRDEESEAAESEQR